MIDSWSAYCLSLFLISISISFFTHFIFCAPEWHLPEKLTKFQNFYIIIARKIFSPILGGTSPRFYVLGGFWPLNITFHHWDPQKALPWWKTRAMSHRASKSVQRCGQDAVRKIQKKTKKNYAYAYGRFCQFSCTKLYRIVSYRT